MSQVRTLDACLDDTLHPERAAEVLATLLRDNQYDAMADYFRVLGEPSRVRLLHCLLDSELCVCDIAVLSNLSVAATSQHLRILRNLDLVKRRREGKIMWYSLADDHIRTLLHVTHEHLAHTQARFPKETVLAKG